MFGEFSIWKEALAVVGETAAALVLNAGLNQALPVSADLKKLISETIAQLFLFCFIGNELQSYIYEGSFSNGCLFLIISLTISNVSGKLKLLLAGLQQYIKLHFIPTIAEKSESAPTAGQ